MKKLLCIVLAFACLLCFGGCGSDGGDHDVVEGPLLRVASGEQSDAAYARLTWSQTWSEHDRCFISADMEDIDGLLDSFVEYPHLVRPITYDGGVTFEPREDVSVGDLDIYAIDGVGVTELHRSVSHDVLDTLEAGEYYIVAHATVEGEYIEEGNDFEKEGYACAFKLIVE